MKGNLLKRLTERLRTQAPQEDGACLACGICLEHEGDEHEEDCTWANANLDNLAFRAQK